MAIGLTTVLLEMERCVSDIKREVEALKEDMRRLTSENRRLRKALLKTKGVKCTGRR